MRREGESEEGGREGVSEEGGRKYSQADMCTEIQELFHFGLQVSNLE